MWKQTKLTRHFSDSVLIHFTQMVNGANIRYTAGTKIVLHEQKALHSSKLFRTHMDNTFQICK